MTDLFDDESAVVRLAGLTQVSGHTRKGVPVAGYVRKVLESFGEGADADTKRGIFNSRLATLKAAKGELTVMDIARLRAELEEDNPVDKLRKRRKQSTSKSDPFVNKTALSGTVDLDVLELGSRASLDRSPGKNWIEETGDLPGYVREIANSLHKDGMSISRAIATALSRIKVWAVTGKPDTKAKAIAALAEWEALRAKNKARQAAK